MLMKSVLFSLFAAATLTGAEPGVTPLGRLELLDGRTLENVVIRSYDAEASKVLVIADGKAMLIPIKLIPPPLAERIIANQSRPAADLIQTTPVRPPEERAANEVKPPPPSTTDDTQTPPRPLPSPAPAQAPPAIDESRLAHREIAKAHVLRYFKYEFSAGSNAISVTDSDIEIEDTEPVPGWNQYRTRGKVYLEFYDSVGGGSFGRRSRTFEVVTEQKPGEAIKVVDFTRK
jgi:hypothetical protein